MKKAIFGTAAILLYSLLVWITPATAKTFETKIIHDPQKVWKVTFNKEVQFNENMNNIYIQTDSGERTPTILKISNDSKTVMIYPQTPYLMGKSYTMIITKDVQSQKKKPIKEETRMSFKIQGKVIQSIQAILNPLVTNVVVQGTQDAAKMSMSVNGTDEIPLHMGQNFQFSRGVPGLINGDKIRIRAYSEQGDLLEEQTYQISN